MPHPVNVVKKWVASRGRALLSAETTLITCMTQPRIWAHIRVTYMLTNNDCGRTNNSWTRSPGRTRPCVQKGGGIGSLVAWGPVLSNAVGFHQKRKDKGSELRSQRARREEKRTVRTSAMYTGKRLRGGGGAAVLALKF